MKVVPRVIEQHAEELGTLWSIRRRLSDAIEAKLHDLGRFDARIDAHRDACVLAGVNAIDLLVRQLAVLSPGRVFAVAAVALELDAGDALAQCLSLGEGAPSLGKGLASALAWSEPNRLRGLVRDLLCGASPGGRALGFTTCRLHGVDAGAFLLEGLKSENAGVRDSASRAAGALGRLDLTGDLGRATTVAEGLWLAWSGVMLGNRTGALERLAEVGLSPGRNQVRAFRLACQAMSVAAGHTMLRQLAAEASDRQELIEGSGIVGDAAYLPWLIEQMREETAARTAGSAFVLITGVNLRLLRLDRPAPENFESGPNDDPDDPNVDMDPDEGLPWPDVAKVEAWWHANQSRFQKGQRYFMGQPVTREHCIHVLKTGYQRQRILAAHYLCLLNPGTPLFNTSAPAWRQQRLLAKM